MDKELQKIQGIIKRLDELYQFIDYSKFSEVEKLRMRAYVKDRYKWFFNWF